MPRNAPITKRTATKRTATKPARHRTTKANGNVFADLGFAPLESASLQLRARLMAELIREAALEGVRDELPHSLAVVIEEVVPREGHDNMLDVHAILYVERSSQKAIIIGKGGSRLKEVGTASRLQIEKLLGTRIYLDLHVKIAKDWQTDPKQMGKLGF